MVQRKNNNGSILWSDADKERLRDLYFEGYTDEEIAEQLGRTATAVQGMRSLLKLKKTRQPHKVFRIHDAMADYYPTWYKKHLLQQWKEQQLTSSR